MGIREIEPPPAYSILHYGRPWKPAYKPKGNPAQMLAYSDEEILVSVANMLLLHEQVVRSQRSPIGRFVSLIQRILGILAFFDSRPTNPDRIEIDGNKLAHLLRLADVSHSKPVKRAATYEIDISLLEEVRAQAQTVYDARRKTAEDWARRTAAQHSSSPYVD